MESGLSLGEMFVVEDGDSSAALASSDADVNTDNDVVSAVLLRRKDRRVESMSCTCVV